MKSILFYCTAFWFSIMLPCMAQESATVFAAKSPEQLYLAAVLEKETLNAEPHRVLNLIDDDITMSFTGLAVKSVSFHADKANMEAAIASAMNSLGDQVFQNNESFSYALKELSSYEAINPFFGQTIDHNLWFGIKLGKNRPKSLLALDLSRVAFSVSLDLPQNGQFEMNDAELAKYKLEDLIYVNSISFGRRVLVLIESNLESSQVLDAIKTRVEGEDVSQKAMDILAHCTFTCVNFGPQEIQMKAAAPFEDILQFMEAEFKAEDYGTPISFGASEVMGNKLFENTY